MNWKIKDGKIEYDKKVLIMGILNVTPDSFSDGGENFSYENALDKAKELINDGADIIDIGAQSTRPNYKEISESEEWERISAILPKIREITSIPISIDTYYPYVAKRALQSGANIINDVSSVVSLEMASVINEFNAGWIIMHNGHGTPKEVKAFFEKSIKECEKLGIDKSSICLDMGIGFNKNFDEDMSLIANVKDYKLDGFPLLLGTSRKRVIGRGSGQENPKLRTYGNIAADTAAILGGVNIIRLHDVKNEKQGILFAQTMKGYEL